MVLYRSILCLPLALDFPLWRLACSHTHTHTRDKHSNLRSSHSFTTIRVASCYLQITPPPSPTLQLKYVFSSRSISMATRNRPYLDVIIRRRQSAREGLSPDGPHRLRCLGNIAVIHALRRPFRGTFHGTKTATPQFRRPRQVPDRSCCQRCFLW